MESPARAPSETNAAADAWLGGVLVVAVLAACGIANAAWPQAYYSLSQEDGAIEWATVWAFVFSAVAHARLALRARGIASTYGLLLAAFCLFVALEEISWGQRLVGYLPPEFFLAQNEQQELTLHNTVEDSFRKLALQAVILAYGALPLLARIASARRLFERLGAVPPPIGIAPAMVATWALYLGYPWRFVGEWVELALGVALLAGVAPRTRILVPAICGVFVAGVTTAPLLGTTRSADPARLESARLELEALHEDWRKGRLRTDCGLHRRLYHVVEDDGLDRLRSGAFASLPDLPEERARFFLDPWAAPYWVMDRCEDDGARRIRVYSTGPNRRRDSTPEEVRPDDLAETILEWVPDPDYDSE